MCEMRGTEYARQGKLEAVQDLEFVQSRYIVNSSYMLQYPQLSQYNCCLPFPCIHAQTMQHYVKMNDHSG
jgi:hypothetical protein